MERFVFTENFLWLVHSKRYS